METYKIDLNINYEQWFHHFLLVKNPNLTQTWGYGDAKMKGQGWKPVRGIIYENETPVALIQAWYKKILIFKIMRVSYGPLWIAENLTLKQIKEIFGIIKKKWNLRFLTVLSISPNLENSPSQKTTLSALKFHKRQCAPYESGIIDLKQPAEILRTKLRQNWRNQLNFSEKKELCFHVSCSNDDFQWIIACFRAFRKEKKFYGHSIKLLNALYTCAFNSHQTWVVIVSKNNERIAGMLFVCYGSSCVPLTIWLNKQGRALNAGNFLLWNSVLHAKKQGFSWFDLGGTNNNTFKTGLPNKRYQLIGEYLVFF